jgi:hypothetical protein
VSCRDRGYWSATPAGQALIEDLEQSPNTHTITFTPELWSSTYADSDANALAQGQVLTESDGSVVRGTGQGTSTTIEWSPTGTQPYPSDGTPRDPTSALMHELWHADIADNGGGLRTRLRAQWSSRTKSTQQWSRISIAKLRDCPNGQNTAMIYPMALSLVRTYLLRLLLLLPQDSLQGNDIYQNLLS